MSVAFPCVAVVGMTGARDEAGAPPCRAACGVTEMGVIAGRHLLLGHLLWGHVIITLALTFLSKCQSWRLIQLFKFKLSEKLPCSPLSRAVLHRDARAGLWGVSLCVLP